MMRSSLLILSSALAMVLPGAVHSVASPATFSVYAVVSSETSGDSDGHFEPSETFTLQPQLSNDGGTTASGVSATLSTTTPGVTIINGSTTYPDIGPTGIGVPAAPFTVQVGSTVPCGTVVDFTLTVNYLGGSAPSQVLSHTQRLGTPGAAQTFTYSGPSVYIPDDGSIVGANLPVTGAGDGVYYVEATITGSSCNTDNTGMNMTVGIEHAYVGDLEISLQAPSGLNVVLINRVGGDGNNFCQTTLTNNMPPRNSIHTVTAANAPFTGLYQPSNSLRAFEATNPNGTWQLRARDLDPAVDGYLRSYSLTIAGMTCDAAPAGGGGGGGGGGSSGGGGSPVTTSSNGGGSTGAWFLVLAGLGMLRRLRSSPRAITRNGPLLFVAGTTLLLTACNDGGSDPAPAPASTQPFTGFVMRYDAGVYIDPTTGEDCLLSFSSTYAGGELQPVPSDDNGRVSQPFGLLTTRYSPWDGPTTISATMPASPECGHRLQSALDGANFNLALDDVLGISNSTSTIASISRPSPDFIRTHRPLREHVVVSSGSDIMVLESVVRRWSAAPDPSTLRILPTDGNYTGYFIGTWTFFAGYDNGAGSRLLAGNVDVTVSGGTVSVFLTPSGWNNSGWDLPLDAWTRDQRTYFRFGDLEPVPQAVLFPPGTNPYSGMTVVPDPWDAYSLRATKSVPIYPFFSFLCGFTYPVDVELEFSGDRLSEDHVVYHGDFDIGAPGSSSGPMHANSNSISWNGDGSCSTDWSGEAYFRGSVVLVKVSGP